MGSWLHELETLHERFVELMTDGTHILRVAPEGWSVQHPLRCRPDLLGCRIHQMLSNGILVRDEGGEYMAPINEEVAVGLYRLTLYATAADLYEPETGRWVPTTVEADPVTTELESLLGAIEALVTRAEKEYLW